MNEHDVDPNASERRRRLRQARDAMRVSPDFVARLERALIEAEATRPPARKMQMRALWMQAPLMLPAALGVMIALYATLDAPTFDAMNVAEHSLELPLDGRGSVALDLALHHHGSDWADVAVHAPRGVRVSTQAFSDVGPDTCRRARCRYDFSHKGDSGSPKMQVHVSQPGRYRMEIEHQSRGARVREVFVIHARR